MEIKALLDQYYQGLARKQGWDKVLSEDFVFLNESMVDPKPVVGKAGYRAVIDRFSQLFVDMRVSYAIIEGNRAFVLANYDYAFPNGVKVNANVAEVWRADHGALAELTIYFDTRGFAELLSPKV